MQCRIALVATLCLALVTPVRGGEAVDPQNVEKLIARLGADSYDDREDAEKQLIEFGVDTLPLIELHKHEKSTEVSFRLKRARKALLSTIAEDEFLDVLGQLGKPKEIAPLEPHPDPDADPPEPAAPADPAAPGAFGARKVKRRKATISVVDGGLKWLAEHQSEDGHWDSMKFGAEANADLAQTALATLTFLGAGHTPKLGQYKENVKKALGWLLSHQRADGAFVSAKGADVDTLAHVIAGMAMAEATGMAKFPEHENSAQLAVNFTLTLQQISEDKRGGFGRTEKTPADILTTTFATLQLKSAKIASLRVPKESFEGIVCFLDQLQDREACAFSTKVDGGTCASATVMGSLCRYMTGSPREEIQPYIENAQALYHGYFDGKRPDVLMNYMETLATFQAGGEIWRAHNEHAKRILEFTCKEGDLAGSLDPYGVRSKMGRVATTALVALSLEVYYAYQKVVP